MFVPYNKDDGVLAAIHAQGVVLEMSYRCRLPSSLLATSSLRTAPRRGVSLSCSSSLSHSIFSLIPFPLLYFSPRSNAGTRVLCRVPPSMRQRLSPYKVDKKAAARASEEDSYTM